MTKDEALDLALEALEYIENNYMSLPKSGSEAITAIKQARSAPVQEPVIDHSCKDTYELIMKWADIYAAQTGNLYAQAAQDPSCVARMADERTMLAAVVAKCLSPTELSESDLLKALKRIVDEPNNSMSDGKALKEIIRIARAAIAKATGGAA